MKRILLLLLAVVIVGGAGIMLFAWSGLYNVGASAGHMAITRWFLEFGMRNSVETHALGIDAPPLAEPALIERGAGHFQGGCAPCHGAPGVQPSPVAQHMLPAPPELSNSIGIWSSAELFWIVRHGIKYTGMPAWPAPVRVDEVWAMVAFLERLPRLGPEEYRRLAMADLGKITDPTDKAPPTALVGLIEGDPTACARCHGLRGEGGAAGGVPRLDGQRPEYLAMSLQDFALGSRPSGIMHPVAIYLTAEERTRLAQYYASLGQGAEPHHHQYAPAPDPRLLELGAAIAEKGVPEQSIPPCSSCHGPRGRAEDKNPRYPALAGQHYHYLVNQLELWRAGVRGGTFAELMSTNVRNITDEQIRAVALYYAGLSRR
jgi:cytochrome c553